MLITKAPCRVAVVVVVFTLLLSPMLSTGSAYAAPPPDNGGGNGDGGPPADPGGSGGPPADPPATATILRATLTPTRAATATIGEGDAGAGSGAFAEAWDLANQITLELVAAREAAEYRGGLTRILLVFAASSALILAVAEGVTSRRRARRAFRIDAATGLVNRGAFAVN